MPRINELECIEGKVWANIWMDAHMIVVDPLTGQVERVLAMASIVKHIQELGFETDYDSVLNGIAFHAPTQRLIISGKRWPKLFQIET